MKSLSLILTFFILSLATIKAQVTEADYQRADTVDKWRDLVLHSVTNVDWIGKTHHFWYQTRSERGKEYVLVNAETTAKSDVFNQEQLASKLKEVNGSENKPYTLNIRNIKVSDDLKSVGFELDGFAYSWQRDSFLLVKKGEVPTRPKDRHWGVTDDEWKGEPVISPDSVWEAYISEFNVYIRNRKLKEVTQLSFDGSAGEFYASSLQWSPNSQYLATNIVRTNVRKYIHFVESSPKNQLQPILHELEYLKPGDALPIRKPTLFNISAKKQIPVDAEAFENQYDLTAPKWWKNSRAFTFEFNQRGHQVYQVAEVDAKTGNLKILVNETSKTFIDYSSKKYRHDINDGKEILWTSERDGWNHLYLFDGSGKLKNQVTKGEWLVREVVEVNDSLRYILFKGSGKNAGEDPYNIHYYRVNFDGSKLTDLTPEAANHNAKFSDDFKYMVDYYSKPDQPTVTVLRSAADGKISVMLEKTDISKLLATGWKTPEVFVAKGRDGKTEIWGNIYRPTNFDPTKLYPIVEYIYAGPHSSFVEKSFSPVFWPASGLAELGFIVVQIDGMGTSNRSKAFHDVCWKNLKDGGFPDRILWMKEAAKKYAYMDTSRVGIFGASAGGQTSTGAVLFHPEFYKVAVSSCGCHDNRMDKMWWNEQFMGYPVGPEYAECSNVVNAGKLKGRLMLILGEIDDNVDPSSTLQVADALIKANKEFELVVLPGVNHTLGGKYGERKRRDFFLKYLLMQEPPEWNE